jgi:hypothetical protein
MWTTREKRIRIPAWTTGALVLLVIVSLGALGLAGVSFSASTRSSSPSSHATPDSCSYPGTQFADAEVGTSGSAVDGPFAMTTGDNLLVIGVAWSSGASVLSVSDTVDSFTAVVSDMTHTAGGFTSTTSVWTATAASTSSLSITVSGTGSPFYVTAVAFDAQGGATFTAGTPAYGSTPVVGSVVNGNCALVYAGDSSFGTGSTIASGGWTQDQQTTTPFTTSAYELEVASAATTSASDAFTSPGGPYSTLELVALGPLTAPAAPTGVTASTEPLTPPHNYGETLIDLAWTNPSGTLTDNHVYVYEQDCITLITSYDEMAVVTGATIGSLTAGTTYCFTVTASNSVGEGAQSTATSLSMNTTLATAATGLSTGTITTSSIVVDWTASPGNVTGYNITLYTGSGCTGAVLDYGALSNVTTATAATLSPSTHYSFTVNSTTAGGQGAGSACLNAETAALPPPPPPPPGGVDVVIEAAIIALIALFCLFVVLGSKRSS